MHFQNRSRWGLAAVAALPLAIASSLASASSHREAPFITKHPKVDGTDFYMFRSYEPGREGYVTLIANYLPLQDPYGGPNYFTLDPDARLRDPHRQRRRRARGPDLPVPLQQRRSRTSRSRRRQEADRPSRWSTPARSARPATRSALNVIETYTVERRPRRSPQRGKPLTQRSDGDGSRRRSAKPSTTSAPSRSRTTRPTRASSLYDVDDSRAARAGPRVRRPAQGAVRVNLGEIFDLVNTATRVGTAERREPNDLADKNVTTLALEVPIACLTARQRARDRRLDHGEPAAGQC